ncbi:hypothetical protein ZWY2020_024264 [Hordeum vulgare]|nr:hypothetical protein ZWY2020_024264 [Hordeum vulgare]
MNFVVPGPSIGVVVLSIDWIEMEYMIAKDQVEKERMSKISQLEKKSRADMLLLLAGSQRSSLDVAANLSDCPSTSRHSDTLNVSNINERLLSSSCDPELAIALDLDVIFHHALSITQWGHTNMQHGDGNGSDKQCTKSNIKGTPEHMKTPRGYAKEDDIEGTPKDEKVSQDSSLDVDDENEVNDDEVPLYKISKLNSKCQRHLF